MRWLQWLANAGEQSVPKGVFMGYMSCIKSHQQRAAKGPMGPPTPLLMMKSLLLAVAILLGISVDNAAAQSRFVPDSISIEYAQCKGDSAQADVLLINRGSSLEILDLRFADSNRTWEIYDSLGGTSYIKGAILFGGDTLALKVRQKPQFAGLTHEWYRDTLVTSGGATSDTLLLNARIQFADLGTDLDSVDFGVMPQGAVVAQIFRVWNSGDAPHIFYVTHSPEWRLDGIANGDTLLPGDTVEAHFVLPGTAPLGTYNPFIAIGGDCDDLGIFRGLRVKIAPQAAHWTAISLIDSSTGCPSGEDYQVTIRNDAQTISFIDSIQILDQASQWSFPPPNNNSFGLQPFTEKTIVLRRGVSGTSTRLVIHSQSTAPDTLQVTFVPMFSRPRIKNSVDTIRLSLKPNEADDQKIEIQNLGTGLYHISDVQLFGDPRWSVLGLDTITTIGQSKSLFITLVFSGAAANGDYPVQALIRGLPCDTLLTQVVVSQVRSLDVAERDAIDAVMVYPTIASNSVTMRSSSKVSYHLYDLLGKEIFGGVAASGDTMLDVSMLPIGRYFLRLESNGSQRTVPITIQR